MKGATLSLTREQVIRAIRIKKPDGEMFGLAVLLMLCFEDVRWVSYEAEFWNIDFDDEISAILFKIAYS